MEFEELKRVQTLYYEPSLSLLCCSIIFCSPYGLALWPYNLLPRTCVCVKF